MSEPDAVLTVEHDTGHVAEGLALLPSMFRRADKLRALLAAHLAPSQAIEDALWQVYTATLASATGAALDQIGELLVWPRGPLSDADYRAVLRLVVGCNRSAGTGPDLLAICAALLTGAWTLTEYFPATVVVEPEAAPALGTSLLHRLLQRAKAAGVKLHTVDVPTGDAFEFASGEFVESDAAHGFSDTSGVDGGAFAGVLA